MQTYISILRGINVSGQKLIKMAELKTAMEGLKYSNVRTYIQSGNVVFQCKKTDKNKLALQLKKTILDVFGFEVPVIIKTSLALKNALKKNPFLKDKTKDPDRMYVAFLYSKPLQADFEKIKTVDYSPEQFDLADNNIYFFSPLGYAKSKMSNNFFENKLKVSATTRNLKTIAKLIEMADEE